MYKFSGYTDLSEAPCNFVRALYFLGMLFVNFTIFRLFFGITISDSLFLLSFMFALTLTVFPQTVPSILPRSLIAGTFLFTISAIFSSINAVDTTHSILSIIKFLFVVVAWFWLSGFTIRKYAHLELAIDCWLISATICSLCTIVQIQWPNIFSGMYSSWGRMAGLSEHPNEMGLISSLALIPLATKFSSATDWRLKCMWVVGLVVTLSGLMLSASIAGLIGATIAFVMWFNFLKKKKVAVALLFIMLAIGYSSFIFQKKYGGQSYVDRFISYQQSPLENTTFGSRLGVYDDAISAIANNMFIGSGLDTESLAIGEEQIHNMLLLVFYGGGVFALIGILLIVFSVWRMARHNISCSINKNQKRLAQALYISYIIALVEAMASPVLYRRTVWLPGALILAMHALGKRNQKCPVNK